MLKGLVSGKALWGTAFTPDTGEQQRAAQRRCDERCARRLDAEAAGNPRAEDRDDEGGDSRFPIGEPSNEAVCEIRGEGTADRRGRAAENERAAEERAPTGRATGKSTIQRFHGHHRDDGECRRLRAEEDRMTERRTQAVEERSRIAGRAREDFAEKPKARSDANSRHECQHENARMVNDAVVVVVGEEIIAGDVDAQVSHHGRQRGRGR